MAKKSSAASSIATDRAEKPTETTAVSRDLEALREFWQTTAPFDPARTLDSLQTRYEQGKALREQTPRESHATWTPTADRADPVATVLASNAGREESLIPLRLGRMAESPFAFLRGACAVMAGDLAQTPISGPQVVIDGDAHINNFGLYGTPQRDVVIDINDFDEATIGPWEWDLKRLVASVNVAGRENGHAAEERHSSVTRCVAGYSENAQRQEDGGWRFVEDPPILTSLDEDTRQEVIASLVEYGETLPPEYRIMLHRYSVADVCHRVVGVGSVGTRAYLVLLFGNGDDDPLFLQVKEAVVPAHAPYLPPLAMRVNHEGRRVIATQRMLQSLGDPLLGYTTIDGRHYFVRQMKNLKASMPSEFLTGEPFEFWGWVCGALLARAHARTGDIAKIAGYIGKSDAFGSALADFAEAYGDQTERDHAALVEAVRTGRVSAHHEDDF